MQSVGLKTAVLIIMVAVLTGPLHAQALPTEQKLGDLQVGGGFSWVKPDYGPGPFYGPSVYSTFDFYHHLGIELDLHFADFHAPQNFAENSYEIGVRYNVGTRFTGPRINFYPKFLYGRAVFNNVFPGNAQQYNEAYNIFTIGGGIEYALKRHINIRIIDFEAQRWMDFPGTAIDNNGLTPYVATVGAAYHF